MDIRLIPLIPEPSHHELRQEFVMVRMADAVVRMDTCTIPGPLGSFYDEAKYSLHMSLTTRKGKVIEEMVDAKLLAIDWAHNSLSGDTVQNRQVQGIVEQPTSCRCGGSKAWFAKTTVGGKPGPDVCLGCTCHTAEDLINRLNEHVWDR